MFYFVSISDGYIVSFGTANAEVQTSVTEEEYNAIVGKIGNKPTAPEGYAYKLRASDLEWELVELPPEPEPEPTVEDKAEAYDILMGVSE